MWLLLALLLSLPFAIVLLVGAPYLPTRKKQVNEALDLLNLKPGDLLVDLGSGDGVVLVEAAKRGIKSIGYELNPLIFIVAYIRTWRYRNLVSVKCRDFWSAPLPRGVKAVYAFLLDPYMEKLDAKLTRELKKGSKLLSYTFTIPGKNPATSKNACYLYKY